jgi:hypothetical protein
MLDFLFCKFLPPFDKKNGFLDSFNRCNSFCSRFHCLVIVSLLIHYEDNFIPNDRCYVSMNTLWTLRSSILAVLRNTCIASPNTDHRVCTLIIQTAEHTAWRIGTIFKLFEGNRIPSINTAYQIKPPLYPSTLPVLHDFSEWEDSEATALYMRRDQSVWGFLYCIIIADKIHITSSYTTGDPNFVSNEEIGAQMNSYAY